MKRVLWDLNPSIKWDQLIIIYHYDVIIKDIVIYMIRTNCITIIVNKKKNILIMVIN